MATITGSTTIDWATVPFDTSQFDDAFVAFAQRFQQLIGEIASEQFFVNTATPTFVSLTLFSGGTVTLSGSNFDTVTPVINVFDYNNTGTGERVHLTGTIDLGASDSITSLKISLPTVEAGVSGSFLLNYSTGDLTGTATSVMLKSGDTSVVVQGSFVLSDASTLFGVTGTVTQIHVVSGTNTVHMTGLSIPTDAFDAVDSIDDLFAVVGANSPGNDTISYTNNSSVGMTFHGGSGNDTITVNGSNADTLFGDSGNDTLRGGLGSDALDGGDGIDTANYAGSAVGVTVDLLAGTGLGGEAQGDTLVAIENLIGSAFNDVLSGDAGPNVLNGGAGNDSLDGRDGNDSMIGGAGDDTYVVGEAGDVVSETVAGVAGGTDTVRATISYVLGPNVEKLVLLGSADLNGTGNGLANQITGNGGANVLNGGAGIDTMVGGLGDDTYVVDNARDVVTEGLSAGNDTVQSFISYTLLDNFENLTLMGAGAINGTGNGADNLITGNAGANVLEGKGGADDMRGGGGSDTYIVDDGGDTATETVAGVPGGVDLVKSSVDFTLDLNLENLTLTPLAGDIDGTGNGLGNVLTGNEGNNVLRGSDGNDTLSGGAGNDRLEGGTGADKMSGGLGDDSYEVANAGDVVTEAAGVGTGTDTVESSISYTLGANVENLTLTDTGNINGTGNAAANTLIGNSGNNILNGGAGVDTMSGGLGDDTYVLDNAAELGLITEAAGVGTGTDTLKISYSVATPTLIDLTSTASLQNVENVTLLGAGAFSVTGNALDNVLTGNAAGNTLAGGAGNDTLNGGAGNDTMVGGLGDDTYVVDNARDVVTEGLSAGNDTVQSFISYTLLDNFENLTLMGAGAINGTGNGADNLITGNAGANVLEGKGGADDMRGGGGSDTYIVDDGGDTATETVAGVPGGVDLVKSSVDFTLDLNLENLTLTPLAGDIDGTGNGLGNVLTGNEGNNVLRGSDGNDTLSGGAGNDRLEGGTGADKMSGGLGDDSYEVANAGDVVTEAAGVGTGTDTVESSISYTLGANVENLTLTDTGNINGTGNAAANTLIGNSGNNILNGGAGVDTMSGGLGDDTYVLDNAAELGLITEAAGVGTGTDTLKISYSVATPTLIDLTSTASLQNVENVTLLGAGAFSVTGNALDNVLTGNAAGNTLAGGAGNDTLNGGAGNDTMVGGLGDDTYVVDNARDVVTEGLSAGNDTVQSFISYTLLDNFENLTLMGAGAINGTGNGADNLITGNAGANVLEGKGGADDMRGGGGSDTYIVDDGGDTATETVAGVPGGVDLVKSSVDFTLDLNLENLTLTPLAGDIDGTGNGLGNVLTGNEGNNVLRGSDGNDTLSGGAGNDRLEGGTGADKMSGGLGDDSYEVANAGDVVTEAAGVGTGTDTVESSISYTLGANVENLTLTDTGNINGTGNAAANTLIGNSGNNILNGGAGVDTMSGGLGDDTYVLDNAAELGLITEAAGVGTGTDTLKISYSVATPTLIDLTSTASLQNVENVTLLGAGAFSVTGNALDNVLTGNAAGNTLAGGAGNDTLNGGAGNDILTGDAGADTFVFNTAPNATTNLDHITDFTSGTDVIQLENAVFTALGLAGALNPAAFASGAGLTGGQDANDRIVYDTDTGHLYYDANGSGAGGATQIATLDGSPAVGASDFHVI